MRITRWTWISIGLIVAAFLLFLAQSIQATATASATIAGVTQTESSKFLFIKNPSAGDDWPLWRADEAITLTKVCYLLTDAIGGTDWVGQLQEADSNGVNGVDSQAADTTASTTNSCETVFSNSSLDSGDYLRLETTSVTGNPEGLHITWYYSIP